ncbi:hypothetical protein Tco_1099876, partial [Tanacetum coccineum]
LPLALADWYPLLDTDSSPTRKLTQWSLEVQRLVLTHLYYQEAPYVPPTAPVVPVVHDNPRDPYVDARDAASVPTTDDNDTAARKETSPSELQ